MIENFSSSFSFCTNIPIYCGANYFFGMAIYYTNHGAHTHTIDYVIIFQLVHHVSVSCCRTWQCWRPQQQLIGDPIVHFTIFGKATADNRACAGWGWGGVSPLYLQDRGCQHGLPQGL